MHLLVFSASYTVVGWWYGGRVVGGVVAVIGGGAVVDESAGGADVVDGSVSIGGVAIAVPVPVPVAVAVPAAVALDDGVVVSSLPLSMFAVDGVIALVEDVVAAVVIMIDALIDAVAVARVAVGWWSCCWHSC